jgi:hypothetical protein
MNQATNPAIALLACESSRIAAHGYDEASSTLALQFKTKAGEPGTVYHYAGVEPETYQQLKSAESIGKFFGAHINVKVDGRLKYPYTKIEPEKVAA